MYVRVELCRVVVQYVDRVHWRSRLRLGVDYGRHVGGRDGALCSIDSTRQGYGEEKSVWRRRSRCGIVVFWLRTALASDVASSRQKFGGPCAAVLKMAGIITLVTTAVRFRSDGSKFMGRSSGGSLY